MKLLTTDNLLIPIHKIEAVRLKSNKEHKHWAIEIFITHEIFIIPQPDEETARRCFGILSDELKKLNY